MLGLDLISLGKAAASLLAILGAVFWVGKKLGGRASEGTISRLTANVERIGSENVATKRDLARIMHQTHAQAA